MRLYSTYYSIPNGVSTASNSSREITATTFLPNTPRTYKQDNTPTAGEQPQNNASAVRSYELCSATSLFSPSFHERSTLAFQTPNSKLRTRKRMAMIGNVNFETIKPIFDIKLRI